MEKFFQKYIHWARHKIKKLEKRFPKYHELLQKFYSSKNARLIAILIIAGAIPITVLGVQQIQDIRQNAAAGARMCTPEEVKITTEGEGKTAVQKITFTGNGVNTATHGFGNNVDDKSCVGGAGSVTCTAKGNFKKTDKVTKKTITVTESTSTWFTLDSGAEVQICQYTITKPTEAPKKPKDPNKTPTAKPTRNPNEPKTVHCEGNLTASACTGDNKPRLSASWNMDGEDGKCKVTLNGDPISTDCSSENTSITANLKSGTSYDLAISNGSGGSCNKRADTETTATCKADTTPTPKGGTATPTSKAGNGSPTVTPKSGQPPAPKNIDFICTNTALHARWDNVDFPNKDGYTYKIFDEDDKDKVVSQNHGLNVNEGGSGNYTPIADHTYRIEVAAKTETTIGVYSKATVTCGKTNSSSTKAATPEGDVKATYINDTTIQVTWADDKSKTKAIKYIIKLTETSGSNPITITEESQSSPAKITLKENQKGKKYYVQIISVDRDDNQSQATAQKNDRVADPAKKISPTSTPIPQTPGSAGAGTFKP